MSTTINPTTASQVGTAEPASHAGMVGTQSSTSNLTVPVGTPLPSPAQPQPAAAPASAQEQQAEKTGIDQDTFEKRLAGQSRLINELKEQNTQLQTQFEQVNQALATLIPKPEAKELTLTE